MLVAVVLHGWRYGFTRLPRPEAGVELGNPFDATWAEIGTDNPWHWARELGPGTDGWSEKHQLLGFLTTYVDFGLVAATNQAAALACLPNQPRLGQAYELATRCVDDRVPTPAATDDQELQPWPELSAMRWLGTYGLWQAAEAEREGDTLRSFNHLLNCWRLRLMTGRAGYWASTREPADVWRRLALHAPLPPRAEVQRLMDQLEALARAEPSLEIAVRRHAWRWREAVVTKLELVDEVTRYSAERPRSLRRMAGRALAQGLGDALQSASETGQWLWGRLTGRQNDDPPSSSALGALGPALGQIAYLTCIGVTRTNDLERMYEGYVSGVVARLRQAGLTQAVDWSDQMADMQARGWRAYLDRPLVWQSAPTLGVPRRLLEASRDRLVQLDTARLTFALRLYREAHGEWPQELAQLVPEFMLRLPLDPHSGAPYLYRRTDNDYLMASVGRDHKRAGWLLSTNRLQATMRTWHVYGSAETEHALAEWKRRQSPVPTVDIRMLMRQGLLPKGFKPLPSDSTNTVATNTGPAAPQPEAPTVDPPRR